LTYDLSMHRVDTSARADRFSTDAAGYNKG